MSALLNRVDFLGVLAGLIGMIFVVVAIFLHRNLVYAAALGVFLYTFFCALYWLYLPREDRYLLGDVCRAWAIADRKWVAKLYCALFVVCSAVVFCCFALALTDMVSVLENLGGWALLALLLWVYALIYLVAGAPLSLLSGKSFSGKNVFISYAHEDTEMAEAAYVAVTQDLRLTAFMDCYSLPAGSPLQVELDETVEHSDVFVVLISRASMGSSWVRREFSKAVAVSPSRGFPSIIPVVLEGTANDEKAEFDQQVKRFFSEAGLGMASERAQLRLPQGDSSQLREKLCIELRALQFDPPRKPE